MTQRRRRVRVSLDSLGAGIDAAVDRVTTQPARESEGALSEADSVSPVVLVPLDRTAAEKLDRRIRRMSETARGNLETVARLVEEAKAGEIHRVLGFASWTAYLADALGGRIAVQGDTRRELVALMAGEGMSERAIATATGASKTTVHRDIGQVVHNGPPQPEASGDAPADEPSAPEPTPVTGMDGKTYPKPKPKPPQPSKPRRKPITTAFFEATFDLGKIANRIGRLVADDRFEKNRNEIARHASDLVRAQEQIASVLAQLHTDQADLLDEEKSA